MSTYSAHVVTGEAVGYGTPEVLIFDEPEGQPARLVRGYPLPADFGLTGALDVAERGGWHFPKAPTQVDLGYWVLPGVELRDWRGARG